MAATSKEVVAKVVALMLGAVRVERVTCDSCAHPKFLPICGANFFNAAALIALISAADSRNRQGSPSPAITGFANPKP